LQRHRGNPQDDDAPKQDIQVENAIEEPERRRRIIEESHSEIMLILLKILMFLPLKD
jgi:hypothetical protein